MRRIRIGLLGRGVVGRGLLELVHRNRGAIRERTGVELSIRSVLVRDPRRHPPMNGERITDRPEEILGDRSLDLIVEAMGGLEPARTLSLAALDSGKHLVTANKLVLARSEIFDVASGSRRRLGFEASVCGGVPIVRALAGLAGDRVRSIAGIVNGTCNFILHRMEAGSTFADALREAQARGFAEADPSLDVDGHDAAQKISILARLAFGIDAAPSIVEGIRDLEPCDLRHDGFVLRHVALASRDGLRVHPALVPKAHPLAAVRDEFNAVQVSAEASGDLLFAGRGAGSLPTASAVLSDILDLAGGGGVRIPPAGSVSQEDFLSSYYLRVPCVDAPGVVGLVVTALENQGVPVRSASPPVVWTGPVRESAMRRAVAQIARLPIVRKKPIFIRVMP